MPPVAVVGADGLAVAAAVGGTVVVAAIFWVLGCIKKGSRAASKEGSFASAKMEPRNRQGQGSREGATLSMNPGFSVIDDEGKGTADSGFSVVDDEDNDYEVPVSKNPIYGKNSKAEAEARQRAASRAIASRSDALTAADVGKRVHVMSFGEGVLRYCGPDHQFKHIPKAGVELDRPVGVCDGEVRGHRYFTCAPNHGVLCIAKRVSLVQVRRDTVPSLAHKPIRTLARQEARSIPTLSRREVKAGTMRWEGLISTSFDATVQSKNVSCTEATVRILNSNVTSGGKRAGAFKNLYDLFGHLDHPNLCSVVGHNWTVEPPFFVMEAPKAVFRPWLRNLKVKWSSAWRQQCLDMMRQVADGLAYLNSANIIHYNLSSRHIHVVHGEVDKPLHLKIGDIGVSKDIKDYFTTKDPLDPNGPTPIRWQAIEVMRDRTAATHVSDIWSFGVLCWEICTQAQTPFNGVSTKDLPAYLESGKRLKRSALLQQPDMTFVAEMIHLCLRSVPDERPRAITLASTFENALLSRKEDYLGGEQAYRGDGDTVTALDYGAVIGTQAATNTTAASRTLSLMYEKNASDLSSMWKVGEGNFGEVYRALLTEPQSTPTPVAVKTLKSSKATAQSSAEFFEEANMLAQFSHGNVLGLLGVISKSTPNMLIIEFCEYGDLKTLMDAARTNGVELRPTELFLLVVQCCEGMVHVSERNVIHRDLAIRNCLMAKANTLKIADMGLARLCDGGSITGDNGTPVPWRWTALEAIETQRYSFASDVWAFGITCWEIYSMGILPYKGIKNAQLPMFIRNGKRLAKPDTVRNSIWDVILRTWSFEPNERPTFRQILKIFRPMLENMTEQTPITREIGAFVRNAAKRISRTSKSGNQFKSLQGIQTGGAKDIGSAPDSIYYVEPTKSKTSHRSDTVAEEEPVPKLPPKSRSARGSRKKSAKTGVRMSSTPPPESTYVRGSKKKSAGAQLDSTLSSDASKKFTIVKTPENRTYGSGLPMAFDSDSSSDGYDDEDPASSREAARRRGQQPGARGPIKIPGSKGRSSVSLLMGKFEDKFGGGSTDL